MSINKIKSSISMLNGMNEESLNEMFEKHGIDETLNLKGVKESVKGGVFNIMK